MQAVNGRFAKVSRACLYGGGHGSAALLRSQELGHRSLCRGSSVALITRSTQSGPLLARLRSVGPPLVREPRRLEGEKAPRLDASGCVGNSERVSLV